MFPDNSSFYVLALIVLSAATAFIFAYIRFPGLRKIDWRIVTAILIFANFLDYISTWYFVANKGIDYEANVLMRNLMRSSWMWFSIHKLVVPSIAAMTAGLLCRKEPAIIPIMLALSTVLTAVAILNVLL
ncbi:MAG: DUF5658 family protein [Candidatus Sungiibacteriota bacterium]